MKYSKLNKIIAGLVFLISFLTYFLTVQSSVPFWDCGEFSTAAYTLGVPHPPGAPFFTILGGFFGIILPFVHELALRINLISVVASALTVMILYLITERVIIRWRGSSKNKIDALIIYGSAFIAALTFNFTDTFWFSAVESEVYASSMFFLSMSVWLGLVWYDSADEPGSERYLFLIAYLMGLSLGVHQLSVLSFFTIGLFVYYRYREVTFTSFIWNTILISAAFLILWPGLINWLPDMLDGSFEIGSLKINDSNLIRYLPIILTAGIIYGIYYSHKHYKKNLNIALVSILLVIIGYTTYAQIIIRANAQPPMNENNPNTMARFVPYMERQQYGDMPSIFERRWNIEEHHQLMYQKYASDGDYFLRYQLFQMCFRYLGWNFIGREGDKLDAPVTLFSYDSNWQESKSFPNRYYSIPFLFGIIGLYYQFRKDWKFGLAFLALFGMLSIALAVYFNMAEPQPRERDYFFVGSFFVFAIWVGCGVSCVIEWIEKKFQAMKTEQSYKIEMITGGSLFIFALAIPINMGIQNWPNHDRHGNFVPFDASYNVLQSVEKDGILFTRGDNDTFPLWYLQDVEGIRRDVRIVNLSLLNTSWYVHQLKDEEPWGVKKISVPMSDEQLEKIINAGYVMWKTQVVELPVRKEVFEAFGEKDPRIITDGKISWTLSSTLGGKIDAIQSHQALVKEIIFGTRWERPIYFAITVPPSERLGLDSYLRLEGFTYRLTPIRTASRFRFDEESFFRHMAKELDHPERERAYGFLFRNLANPKLYFNPEDQRMIKNYRLSWLIAAFAFSEKGRRQDVVKVLDLIEQRTPEYNFPMNINLKYDIANLYLYTGRRDKYEIYIAPVEKYSWDMIHSGNVSPEDKSAINPWHVLLEIYETRNDLANELEVYRTLIKIYPNDSSLIQRAADLKRCIDSVASISHQSN